MFLLSYLAYVFLNIGMMRFGTEFNEILQYIILSIILLYVILSPLRTISNIVLFLIIAEVTVILACLLTPLILFNFTIFNITVIAFIYVLVFVKSLMFVKNNVFLKWLLSIASLFTVFYLLCFYNALVDNEGIILFIYNFSYVLFFIASLAMIFGIPNSDLPDWEKEHRQFFGKLILPVWIFIFFISTLKIFMPFERFKEIITPESKEKWGMTNYSVEQKPGLAEY